MSLITFAMWTIASLGITAEMLFLLIPWALDWIPGTDALLARTLFWFTGHPIVYFWLLPAYVSWYTMGPYQAGGGCSATPWRECHSSSSCPFPSPWASTISMPTQAFTRAGSCCTPS